MADYPEVNPIPTGIAEFREAKNMWEEFYANPDIDQQQVCEQDERIRDSLLTNHKADPREAAWICKQAGLTVLEQLQGDDSTVLDQPNPIL